MKGIVERVDPFFVVVILDDGRVFNVDFNKLPKKVKRGDVVDVIGG